MSARNNGRRRPLAFQAVAGASPASSILNQYAAPDQVAYVPEGGILRAFGNPRPFRTGQLGLEPVQQTVKHLPLSLIDGQLSQFLPKPRFQDSGGQDAIRIGQGLVKHGQEPGQPGGDVEVSLLGCFKRRVVGWPLQPEPSRHAVAALTGTFGPGKHHVSYGTANAPVPIIERMNCYEPDVSQSGFQDEIRLVRRILKPAQEAIH